MNFSLIVPLINISNTGEVLAPTDIAIFGEAKDQFNYTFWIGATIDNRRVDITDLYETLVGTSPDCDKRFTEPIEAHLELLFSKQPQHLT